jgi:hypothetical protein
LVNTIATYTPPAYPFGAPWVTFRSLGAQAARLVTAGLADDDAVAGAVLLAGAAGLEELAGADGELDDDPQPAASPAKASAATTRARFAVPERSTSGNTAVPPNCGARCAIQQV